MTTETQRYIEIAQKVAAAATGETLQGETAIKFCQFILPPLLVELEIAHRVDAVLAQRIAPPAPQPAPQRPVAAKKKKAAKPRKKRKGKRNDTATT